MENERSKENEQTAQQISVKAEVSRSGAPRVKKFGKHASKKFGFWENCPYGVRRYVRPPLHVSHGEILHFKYPRVSAVNRIATPTFRDKKQQQRSRFFLSTSFFKSTSAWITEKALEPEIEKQRGPISFEE